MSMITNIAKDVAKNIEDTGSLELILTTGSAIQKMFLQDANVKEKEIYLVKFNKDGKISSYQNLQG